MNILTVLFVSVGLSMDAFAIAITLGFAIKYLRIKHAFRVGAFFGGFQAIMPIIGWSVGIGVRDFFSRMDHWITFYILGVIGIKMIVESKEIEESEKEENPLRFFALLILAIATSIDALAVGFSLSFLKVHIIEPAMIIGCITFAFSFCGVYIGNRMGHFFEKKMEVFGGLILLFIGIKILIQHLLEQ